MDGGGLECRGEDGSPLTGRTGVSRCVGPLWTGEDWSVEAMGRGGLESRGMGN